MCILWALINYIGIISSVAFMASSYHCVVFWASRNHIGIISTVAFRFNIRLVLVNLGLYLLMFTRLLMGLRATLFFFFVFPCFFICKWHGRSFLPWRNRETTFHQQLSHHVMTVNIYVILCVYLRLFLSFLVCWLIIYNIALAPELFLFVCVCQIKQTARQPRNTDRIWPLFHLKHNMEPLPSC